MRKLILGTIAALSLFIYGCQDDIQNPTPIVENVQALAAPTNPLDLLPKDTGGKLTPYKLGSNQSPYGYYLYTPGGYSKAKYPLLIFLHGAGEKGNSSVTPSILDKTLVHGPGKLIKAKQWNPKYPMVVASIQCHDGAWTAAKVKQTTEFLMKTYNIDTTRIYLTGLSMGGVGVWNEITIYGKGSHITAAVPICGQGVLNAPRTKAASAIPIWAFHGDKDTTVKPTFDIAEWKAINALNPPVKMKLTMYPGVGHDSWTRTYNGTGQGQGSSAYDQFNMDIYSWMLQYAKKK